MFRRNDKSGGVQEFQNKLLRLGMALPRWGADSELGNETFAALAMLCTAHGRPVDPDPEVVSDVEINFVDALIKLLDTPIPVKEPARLIDRRKFASLLYDRGPRAITDVWGMTIHQTACILSASKDPARCDAIGSHFVIMRAAGGYYGDGDVLWIHDDTRLVIHGNEWNTKCTGTEIDGLFAGLEGNPKTVWDNPKTPYKEQAVSLTDKQEESALQLIEWEFHYVRQRGGNMTSLNTHRQSSADRQNDPGSKVCQRVLVPMWAKLGLSDGGPGFVLGGPDGGYPNPTEWVPNDPARAKYHYNDPPTYKPVR